MANYHDIRYDMTLSSSTTGGGSMVLLETQTASSSSTISFTSNIDSTYDKYVFKFYDIHPATDGQTFTFQGDTGTNTSYNQTITSAFFWADHMENDTDAELTYKTDQDQHQGTSFQNIGTTMESDDADSSGAGFIRLYDPSNTTFVTHFSSMFQMRSSGTPTSRHQFVAGYFNTTTALTRFQFKFESGNIDNGDIILFGLN